MTAAAAAEKQRKKDELYYKFNISRGMGYSKSRMRDYDDAVKLFTNAIEHAEPGFEQPLIIARSKAYSKLVNHEAARTDALKIVKSEPSNIRGLENDAYTLYEKDDFEDSLVRSYRGLRKRKKPDNFYRGILVGKETIEDTVGRNAGPCLDQDRLGRTIVEMHMKRETLSDMVDELALAKKKYEKERIDRIFAQKYLGRLAADKQFLIEFLKLPDLKSGNMEHNKQLEELISHMIETINRQQETLMTQRPMYMLKHHEPKFSKKFQEKRAKEEQTWRGGVVKVIDRLLDTAENFQRERKLEACMSTCERLRRFLDCQPRSLLTNRSREVVLDKLYDILGTAYMDTKSMISEWSNDDNERRIDFILQSKIDDQRFIDRATQSYFPKICNVKEMKTSLKNRLELSIHRTERAYLYHEMSRCLFEERSIELAYKAASAGYKIAKDTKNTLWAFNTGFLLALAVLQEGNTDDAKIAFREANISARKLERDDCNLFVQRIMKIITNEHSRLNFAQEDSSEKREREIIRMMPTLELKVKAHGVMQRVARAPHYARLSLHPSQSFKPVTQGGSRRSMRVTTRAKRRTLYDTKSSRHQTTPWTKNTKFGIHSSLD